MSYFYLNLLFVVCMAKYQPTWDSIDSRPLPEWYDDVKFGIFCHWGVYSVPAYRSEWMWWYWKGDKPDPNVVKYVNDNYKPGTTYADFARDFTAQLFDPNHFVDVVKSSGAKYFVLTSKHHEGFTMWPSASSWNWNAKDVGPKRDIVGDLKKAFDKSEVHFGLYFSQFEWFHPIFVEDSKSNTTKYVDQVSYPQMIDIVNKYNPEVIWSDGDWGKSDNYWKSKEFLAWLYNESPVKNKVVVNDRWGGDSMGKHGGFLTYSDHYDPGKLLQRKWENCLTIDKKSWGNRRDLKVSDVCSVHELIEQLARTVACGGNMLLNIGPDNYGRIPLIMEDRLQEMGRFLNVTSEALYGTKPWIHQNDTGNVWFTARYRSRSAGKKLYVDQIEGQTIIYAWVLNVTGKDIVLNHIHPLPQTKVTILGTDRTYSPKKESDRLLVPSRYIPWQTLPRQDVIILKIEYAASQQVKQQVHKKVKEGSYGVKSFIEDLSNSYASEFDL